MRETWHLFQKLLVTRYLWVTSRIWRRIPVSLRSLPVFVSYGAHLHSLVLRFADRRQNHSTFFLRNRAELELMRRLAARASYGPIMDIAIFACSKGAEVYSIAWTLKAARPDLTFNIRAIDISQEIVEFVKQGVYSLQDPDVQAAVGVTEAQKLNWNTHRDQGASPVDWMFESEKDQMFDREGDYVRVKSWIKEGISWHCADAGDPELVSMLGRQDMVVANRFLCHMDTVHAERILRNLGRVLKPGGYLFVSGIDLDVRTRVALDMKWKPISELMEGVHDGDPSIRDGWPFEGRTPLYYIDNTGGELVRKSPLAIAEVASNPCVRGCWHRGLSKDGRILNSPRCPMHSWDQMKPRTVYDKAVQDLTYTARQLTRLDQNFCRASFEEFKLLMGLDAEAQKRYGLPPPVGAAGAHRGVRNGCARSAPIQGPLHS